jgi:hypothetical protein
MSVTPSVAGAAARRVLVNFGHHCFTRDVRAGDTAEMTVHHKRHQNDARSFCSQRYTHSLSLPTIIRTAASGRAYFGQAQAWRSQNYLLVENLPGMVGPYAVFFDMMQSHSKNLDVVMFVNSAYEKPNLPPRLRSLPFATLVATIAAGNPVIKPKK